MRALLSVGRWERLSSSIIDRRDAERIITRLAPLCSLKRIEDRSRFHPCPQTATRLLSLAGDIAPTHLVSLPTVLFFFVGSPPRRNAHNPLPHASLDPSAWSVYLERTAKDFLSSQRAETTSNENLFTDDLTVVNTLRDLTFMRAPLTQPWLDALKERLTHLDYSQRNIRTIESLVSVFHSVCRVQAPGGGIDAGIADFNGTTTQEDTRHLSNDARSSLRRIFTDVVEHCVQADAFNSSQVLLTMISQSPSSFLSNPEALTLVVKYYRSLLDPERFAIGVHMLRSLCVLGLLTQDILEEFRATMYHNLERFARYDYTSREAAAFDSLHDIALYAELGNMELHQFSSFPITKAYRTLTENELYRH